MLYLIMQIFLALLIAAALGFLIAWLLRGFALRRQRAELEKAHEAKAAAAPIAARGVAGGEARLEMQLRERDLEIERLNLQLGEQNRRLQTAMAGKVPLAGDADDLKLIPGIGEVLEQTLHSIGINSYKQIATFTDKEIERVSQQIGPFKGRILRDDWKGSARRLYEMKYGKPVS